MTATSSSTYCTVHAVGVGQNVPSLQLPSRRYRVFSIGRYLSTDETSIEIFYHQFNPFKSRSSVKLPLTSQDSHSLSFTYSHTHHSLPNFTPTSTPWPSQTRPLSPSTMASRCPAWASALSPTRAQRARPTKLSSAPSRSATDTLTAPGSTSTKVR